MNEQQDAVNAAVERLARLQAPKTNDQIAAEIVDRANMYGREVSLRYEREELLIRMISNALHEAERRRG